MTIAQQLKIKKFPFIIKDDNGNVIYSEYSSGCWWKKEYDDKGNEIYLENSDGFWLKSEYDDKRNRIYYENSSGFWWKGEYDSKGNQIHGENSDGYIIDNRPKVVPEYTMEQLVAKVGHDFKIKK